MSDENPSENVDSDERSKTPRTIIQLFRDAWEELRRDRTEDLSARSIEIVTKHGETLHLSCFEFWVQMIKEVEEQKEDSDYLYSPLAEQRIWEKFTVAIEYPTNDESSICVRGLYYTPRPSNLYLQNLNLGYDQWFLVQDFPPKPRIIKILRRKRNVAPSCEQDDIILQLIHAMEWSSPTPSVDFSSRGTIDLTAPLTEYGNTNSEERGSPFSVARRILNVTPNSSPTRSPEPDVNDEINLSDDDTQIRNTIPDDDDDSENINTPMPNDDDSQEINSSVPDDDLKIINLPNDDLQKINKPIPDDDDDSQKINTQRENTSTGSSQFQYNSTPLVRWPRSNYGRRRFVHQQGDHRSGVPQQFKPYCRGRGFRLQRVFRQPPSLLQRLPLEPAPAHLPVSYLNPRFPYPAHQAIPHYDSAWNLSNSYVPYQVIPWDYGVNQSPASIQTPIPQIYTEMPYVQIPGPYWFPTEGSQMPQPAYPSVMTQNPWTPYSEPISINNAAQQQYYPAENYQMAHQVYHHHHHLQIPLVVSESDQSQYPFINNTIAHQSSIVYTQNILPQRRERSQNILRSEVIAARSLEMNYNIIHSHQSVTEKTSSKSHNLEVNREMTHTHLPVQTTTTEIQPKNVNNIALTCETKDPSRILQIKVTESHLNINHDDISVKSIPEAHSIWTAQTPVSSVIPLPQYQFIKNSDKYKFYPPSSTLKPTENQSTVYQKQSDQKRKAVVQFHKTTTDSTDSKTTKHHQDTQKSNKDKKNKEPVDEREYLRTPSIFEILEARKNADPNEKEKAPTNYLEDVIQRKERRWTSMNKVPGCPRLDLILEMIRKDNEMLEEEERLQREKEKVQTTASGSSIKEKKLTRNEHENVSQEKSEIYQHVSPIQIAGQADDIKLYSEVYQKPVHVPATVEYSDAIGIPSPTQIKDVIPLDSYQQDEPTSAPTVDEFKDVLLNLSVQSCDRIVTLSSEEVIQSTPARQKFGIVEKTAVNICTVDKIKVEIDDDEMALLNNLTSSTGRFNPEVWVSDKVVLQLKDKFDEKRSKSKSTTQPTTSVPSKEESDVDQAKKNNKTKQKLAKRPPPIKKQISNNDQPIKKKRSYPESSTKKSKSEETVIYCATDQAIQTNDVIEYEDNASKSKDESSQTNEKTKPKTLSYAAVVRSTTKVPVKTKNESSQAVEEAKPKILSYAAVVRKNKK